MYKNNVIKHFFYLRLPKYAKKKQRLKQNREFKY